MEPMTAMSNGRIDSVLAALQSSIRINDMKATVQQQQLLLDLQSIDNKWRRNRAKADSLSETGHLKTIVVQRKAIAVKKANLRKDIQELHQQRDAAQRQADAAKDAIDELDSRMMQQGSSAKTIQALQRQKATTQAKRQAAEDQARA